MLQSKDHSIKIQFKDLFDQYKIIINITEKKKTIFLQIIEINKTVSKVKKKILNGVNKKRVIRILLLFDLQKLFYA